jgi:hypothetical protein
MGLLVLKPMWPLTPFPRHLLTHFQECLRVGGLGYIRHLDMSVHCGKSTAKPTASSVVGEAARDSVALGCPGEQEGRANRGLAQLQTTKR